MRDFLECQAYVVHLRNAHKQIHELVGAIERELRAVEAPCEPTQLRASLQRLRETLLEHFKQEEQGGCLEQAVSCVPRLAAEAVEIEKEHATLSNLLDRLVERSADCDADEFRESFREFAMILHAHESAENRILQTAFGTGEFESHTPPPAYGETR